MRATTPSWWGRTSSPPATRRPPPPPSWPPGRVAPRQRPRGSFAAVWVKIEGITTEEDALLAIAMGADALGFVFAPSPRQMAPNRVRDILTRLPPEILTIGVFRDQTPEEVVRIVHSTGLKAAQLHGRETPEVTRAVRQQVG